MIWLRDGESVIFFSSMFNARTYFHDFFGIFYYIKIALFCIS